MKLMPDSRPAALLPPGCWTIDPERSEVGFRIRHLAMTHVSGRFAAFAGEIEADADAGVRITGRVGARSVDTGEHIRDARLVDEFFAAAAHPLIEFEAARAAPDAGGTWTLAGRLTIKGTTREVLLRVEVARVDEGTARLVARGQISRRDFGLEWSALVEAGRLVVGDRVELRLDVVAVPIVS